MCLCGDNSLKQQSQVETFIDFAVDKIKSLLWHLNCWLGQTFRRITQTSSQKSVYPQTKVIFTEDLKIKKIQL